MTETKPTECQTCGGSLMPLPEGNFVMWMCDCDRPPPTESERATATPKPDVCLACGCEDPHLFGAPSMTPEERAHEGLCTECLTDGRFCTADRRTIAAQAKRIEELEDEIRHLTEADHD